MYTSPLQRPLAQENRPEQTFFEDPALDRVLGVLMSLATEVNVTNAKLAAIEKHLENNGLKIDWDKQTEDPVLAKALDQSRKEFVDYLLDPLLGLQKSKSAA